MKKLIFLFLILTLIVTGCNNNAQTTGNTVNPKQINVDTCPCGCNEDLVTCGCPTAKEILNKR